MLKSLHQFSMGYLEIFAAFLSLLCLFSYCFRNKNGLPTEWPLVGMLPLLLKNHHRIHDFIVEVIQKSQLTFFFKGPSFSNMNLLATVDPANVHHVLSKNFENYPKGSKFKEIFEILGEGILNSDSDVWKHHRKLALSFLHHPGFNQLLVEKIWEKIKDRLIPFVDHASKEGSEIELQDFFARFTFDTNCSIIIDHDPRTLSINLPEFPFAKALRSVEKAILYRYVVPTCVWKFQRWLGVGQEKKYREAWKIIDDFLYKYISRKREEKSKNSESKANKVGGEVGIDLIALYMDEVRDSGVNADKFLRDAFLTYFIAGLKTVSVALPWFFYILSKNPHVLSKIKDELDATIVQGKEYDYHNEIEWNVYDYLSRNFDELSGKLIYLQAAINESLRLYPPVAYHGSRIPVEHDTLPSGHKVDPSVQIMFSSYAMGRMESIWGGDCREFKPERWISETGKIRHEPSYKFLVFNSGPRTCTGRNMSLTQMKAIVIAIISKYHLQPVEENPIIPDVSFILHMKHEFKVKVLAY